MKAHSRAGWDAIDIGKFFLHKAHKLTNTGYNQQIGPKLQPGVQFETFAGCYMPNVRSLPTS